MRALALLIAATLALPALLGAAGCGGWRARDTALQAVVLATFAVDHRQTLAGAADCREGNPIMGACGERVHPTLYFATAGILHVLAVATLPPAWRGPLQGATIGVQAKTIYANDRALRPR